MKRITPYLAVVSLLSSQAVLGNFGESFKHIHRSPSGAPFLHSFNLEPAFTGRDFFADYAYRKGDGVTGHELEFELEWAFTRQLGMIIEVPYLWEKENGASASSGFGDLAIVPRVLLIERDRFLLTLQTELTLPTGSSTFGGETAVAPGIATWNDLGNLWTLNAATSIEHGFNEDSTEFHFGIGLIKSFATGCEAHGDHDHHDHSPTGLLSLHLEATGSTPLNGEEKGDVSIEGLIGLSYGVAEGFDIRAGYLFPITSPGDFDKGFTAGIIIHF